MRRGQVFVLGCILAIGLFVFPTANSREISSVNHGVRSKRGSNFHESWKLALPFLIMSFCYDDNLLNQDNKKQQSAEAAEEKKKQCVINVKQLKSKHALIIDAADHTKFRYPNKDGLIVMEEDEPIFLSCTHQSFGNMLPSVKGLPYVTLKCVEGTVFRQDSTNYNFYEMSCEKPPQYVVKTSKYGKYDLYTQHDYGFIVDYKKTFLSVNEIHSSGNKYPPLFAKSVIPGSIAGQQSYINPLRIVQEECCGSNPRTNMNEVFYFENQEKSSRNIFTCDECDYVNSTVNAVFSRNLLTPRTSYIYKIAGNTTFSYLNSAPMWVRIFFGNAFRIEAHVYRMARELRRNITVYSGSSGELNLANGLKPARMELQSFETNEKFVVPNYFYKIAVDKDSNTGVVFVTINNPYLKTEEFNTDDNLLCAKPITEDSDIEMPESWVPGDVERGYSYMCQVGDFLEVTGLSIIPDFQVLKNEINGLLYIPKEGFKGGFAKKTIDEHKDSCHNFFPPPVSTDKDCRVDFKSLPPTFSLLVDAVDNTKLLYPDESGQLVLPKDGQVRAFCNRGLIFQKYSNMTFTCKGDNQLVDSNGDSYHFNSLICNSPASLRGLYTPYYPGGNAVMYFGFPVGQSPDTIIDLVIAYHIGHYPLFTRSIVSKTIRHRIPLPSEFDKKMPHAYLKMPYSDKTYWYNAKYQISGFKHYLHQSIDKLDAKLVETNPLVPQLLSPKNYFSYPSLAQSANVFMNSRPMFKSISEGNWARTEEHVFKMIELFNQDLVVYTGGFGALKVRTANEDSPMANILLDPITSNYTIPRYFFKIVIEPLSKRGVVYITRNDIFRHSSADAEFKHTCKKFLKLDVEDMPRWIKGQNQLEETLNGESFACSVDDFIHSSKLVEYYVHDMRNDKYIRELGDINSLLLLHPESTHYLRDEKYYSVDKHSELR